RHAQRHDRAALPAGGAARHLRGDARGALLAGARSPARPGARRPADAPAFGGVGPRVQHPARRPHPHHDDHADAVRRRRLEEGRPGRPVPGGGFVTGVRHQKWWGWGVEGIKFDYRDKPRMAPFVLDRIGIDLSAPGTPPPSFEDIAVPAPQLPTELAATLRSALGDEHVVTEDLDRVVHTYGKGLADLVRVRAGYLPRVPDVVVYPGSEDEVRAVVDAVVASDSVLIPFGGGSNISGSLTPPAHESRTVVSLDLGRLNRVLEIDEDAGL